MRRLKFKSNDYGTWVAIDLNGNEFFIEKYMYYYHAFVNGDVIGPPFQLFKNAVEFCNSHVVGFDNEVAD